MLDADHVVHRLLAEDEQLVDEISRTFGDVVGVGGGVDRAALAGIVFGDPGQLAALEALLFPAVRRACEAWLARQTVVAVVEAVKLVESGMHQGLDRLWLLTCDRRVRRRRLEKRGWSGAQIADRMAAGGPLLPRLAAADVVVDNSGDWSATRAQLARAWHRTEEQA